MPELTKPCEYPVFERPWPFAFALPLLFRFDKFVRPDGHILPNATWEVLLQVVA